MGSEIVSRQTVLWIVFSLLIAGMLYIDLFLADRSRRAVGIKEAAVWCGVWAFLALLFCGGIYVFLSPEKALQFFTGYVIEQSLSVDNMFVFLLIFSYFKILPRDQPRVLKWGILGAVVLRFLFIFIGTALVDRFQWIFYLFGAFLLYTAYGMAFGGEKEFDPGSNPVLKRITGVLPLGGFDGDRFFTRATGAWMATPLFLTILVVEFSDLVFALDSIPAIFAITTDRFIVYTSNVFAILGLRSLYFMIAGMVQVFAYLKFGVAIILAYVGVKMLLTRWFPIPTLVSLGVIVSLLAASVAASLLFKPKES